MNNVVTSMDIQFDETMIKVDEDAVLDLEPIYIKEMTLSRDYQNYERILITLMYGLILS
jgi:uncharacterized protein YlaN (UPF0358 family)